MSTFLVLMYLESMFLVKRTRSQAVNAVLEIAIRVALYLRHSRLQCFQNDSMAKYVQLLLGYTVVKTYSVIIYLLERMKGFESFK